MALDAKMKCLCCDKTILIDSKVWAGLEEPFALCQGCRKTTPMATVKVIYLLRSQVVSLQNEMFMVKKDVVRLFKAQQEMEQDLVRVA